MIPSTASVARVKRTPRLDDPEDTPVFGERVAGESYVVRPSAYALVPNTHGQLATVKTRRGWWFPGGGIEMGETAREAVVREVLEECAIAMRPSIQIGCAVQLVHSPTESTYFEKTSLFFAGVIEQVRSTAAERDHELIWLAPEEAARVLSHESHRWAVVRWKDCMEHRRG